MDERTGVIATSGETRSTERQEPIPTGFDVFVLVLSVLSIVNIALTFVLRDSDVNNVVLIVDGVFSLIFLADFLLRLRRAPSKRGYFFHDGGWLDLLGSLPLPGLRLARVFRVVRVGRAIRQHGVSNITSAAMADRAGSSMLVAIFLTIIVLQYGSMAMLIAEEDAENPNIVTASDALWWSYVTITTVGYGDRYPVTNIGRNIGVLVLTIGVGLFGVLTGFLANLFLAPKRARRGKEKDTEPDMTPNPDLRHELDELRGLIAELRAQTIGAARVEPDRTTDATQTPSTAAATGRNNDGRS